MYRVQYSTVQVKGGEKGGNRLDFLITNYLLLGSPKLETTDFLMRALLSYGSINGNDHPHNK